MDTETDTEMDTEMGTAPDTVTVTEMEMDMGITEATTATDLVIIRTDLEVTATQVTDTVAIMEATKPIDVTLKILLKRLGRSPDFVHSAFRTNNT